jgi:ammonia channel protein AmtB
VVLTYWRVRLVALVTPPRPVRETETDGLDLSVHGETADELTP